MLNPDFSERTYTAEVMKTEATTDEIFKAILRLTIDPEIEDMADERLGCAVKVGHSFLASRRLYHRSSRTVVSGSGQEITVPRQKTIRGQECSLYDVFVAQYRYHVIVAVPFHELAEEFFVRIDRTLMGSGIHYERLDITEMVIKLGSMGTASILQPSTGETVSLSLTRCHLAYADQQDRSESLQQVRMTGANLGLSNEYRVLVAAVLNRGASGTTVTPVILGFALSSNGVRKSSATTDRHGNFKLWIAPGLRRLVRLFGLLEALEAMKKVTLTTSNVPILRSKTIRDAED